MRPAQRAAPAKRVHYERRRPEETTLYRVVQENLETFLAQVEAGGASSWPQFVKDEFEAFLECGILSYGFLRVRCAACGHEKLVAISCKLRGICPSCGGAAHGGNGRLAGRSRDSQSAGSAVGAVVPDSAAQPHRGAARTARAGLTNEKLKALLDKIITHMARQH